MSGTSQGLIDNFNGTAWSQESYFNLLSRKNISWSAYYDLDVWALAYFEDMKKQPNSLNVHEIGNLTLFFFCLLKKNFQFF